MPKISVCIVTHNSMKYLPYFLDSLFEQTYFKSRGETPDIFIVDNASADKTVKFIHDNFPTVHLLRNVNNIGLCRAWNQAIKMTNGEYILIMNPDLILEKKYLAEVARVMDNDDLVGAVGGKLYQLKITNMNDDEGMTELTKTNIIDTTGLTVWKSRCFTERGGGQIDNGQFDDEAEVFGVSGACVLLRRRALEQIKFNEEYFDEDFFIYQEDIDLAWRLRQSGWSAVYTPRAIGYHHRRAHSGGQASAWSIIKYRREKENFINAYSYRNHLLLLLKNEAWRDFWRHSPYILFYELKKFAYVLILENSTLRRALVDIFKFWGKIRQKRSLNKRLTKVAPEEIRQWFR